MQPLPERVRQFYEFMAERELIRLRKEAGQPRPWTDDPILHEFKFTNVKREHDKTSRKLKAHYDEHRDKFEGTSTGTADLLFNCAVARYFGIAEFVSLLGWVKPEDVLSIKEFAAKRIALGESIFTGAYVITNGGIKGKKHEVIVDHYLSAFAESLNGVVQVMEGSDSWRRTAERMMETPGFGGTGFMTKEVLLDYIMASGWTPLDWQTWTPVGPGGQRGVARLLGIDTPEGAAGKKVGRDKQGLQRVIGEVYQLRHENWSDNMVKLDLTDIQFQLCEFDKYERVRLGQGRPRSRYR